MSYYVHLPNGEKMLFEDSVPQDQARYQAMLSYYTPKAEQIEEPKKPQSTAGLGSDIVGSLIRGGGSLVELPGNVYGLATGNFDNPLTRAGHEIQQYGESFYSPAMRAAQQNIEETQKAVEGEGGVTQFLSTTGAYFRNPRALFGAAVEQGPMLAATMGGGLAARAGAAGIRGLAGRQLTGKAAEAAAARAGTVGAVGTGAVMQGADVAGDTYKEMMGQDQEVFDKSEPYRRLVESGLKPEEAKQRLALEAAREAGLLSGAASAALGAAIPGVERIPFTQASKAGIVRRVLTGGTQEFLQEGIEEGSGKYLSNLALSRVDEQRDLMRGVGSAAAAGALPGGILGGAGHALRRAPREAPSTRGENPELRAAIDESRSMTQIETPIGNISWNDAYDIYNQRYPNIAKIVSDEDTRISVGNILLNEEIEPIKKKIDELRENMERASSDEEAARIKAKITKLENSIPSVERPKRGFRGVSNEKINAALNQVRGTQAAAETTTQTPQAPVPPQAPITPQEVPQTAQVEPQAATESPQATSQTQEAKEAPSATTTPSGTWRPTSPDEVHPPGRKFRMNTTTGQSEVFEPSQAEAPTKPRRATKVEPSEGVSPQAATGLGFQQTQEAQELLAKIDAARGANDDAALAVAQQEYVEALKRFKRSSQETVFTTAKGSTYVSHGDGTTTRNKSYHPEHGVKDQGIQPRSEATIFLHPEEVNKLSLIQATNPYPVRIAERPDSKGKWGIQVTEGPDAGKFYKDTTVTPTSIPSVGLIPVELWNNGLNAHFGNPITKVEKRPTKGGKTQPSEKQATPKQSTQYSEVPRKTEWTGESQFAVAPEATQAAPEAATESTTTPPPPVTLKANKVIEDFLSGLEKRGKLGKQSAEELRRVLADRQLNNNQVYAAFLAAEQANNLLPQTADHRLEFVKKLYGNDMKAAAKSGASNVNAVGKLQQVEAQGERIAPKKLPNGTIEQGIIRISLAENMLAVIQETTAHEAYHVLQDYYSKYDPDFRKMIDSKFVATHDLVDANGKPIIGKDNKPVKGMYMSEIDQSIIDKLSKFKAANGESYWNNLTVDVKNLVSQEEAQAYAFAALHDANLRGMPITNLVPAYRRFINFLKNFFSNMKKSLRRDGYKTFADVFGEPRTEKFGGKAPVVREESQKQLSAKNISNNDATELFNKNEISDMNFPRTKSREKLINIPINNFLSLADEGFVKSKFDNAKNIIQKGEKFSSIPVLIIDKDGKVVGHEGRHRAMALRDSGYDNMPVILKSNNIRWSEQNNINNFDYVEKWPKFIEAQSQAYDPKLKLPFPVSRDNANTPYTSIIANNVQEQGSQFSARDMSRYKSLYNQQTNSPEFKKWFGDSKAVDEDGKPIVFYHGTSKDTDFDKFNISKRGAWFTNDPLLSSEYAETNDSQKIVYENGKYVKKHKASRVIPAYLKIENPYTGEYPENYKYASNYAKAQREFFDELKSKGYDGWIMNNGQVAVVFNSPAQIKSAIGNVGTFDESNPRIQYSARDVSQYALRPPAAAGASVLERVTGEHYSKPSIFDRALGKIFGAKEGESFKSAAWRTIVNRTYPVYVLEDLMRSQGKWTGRAVARAMEMALNNTGRIQTLLDHGLIKYNKNTGDVEFLNGSKALRDIFGGRVPDSLKKEFQLYGVALRERDLRKNGKQGFFNITDKEVADTIQKYEAAHPEWKNVAADLQKFNEGLIQFALDTGTIDQKTAAKLNSMFYTPYYRQMQTDVDGAPEQVLGPSLTRSLNNPRVFAHPLKGGSEAIGDLYENIIRNADSIIRAGMKNVAMKDASKLLQIANLATPTTHAGTRDERVITFRDNGKPVHFRIDDPVLWSAIGGLPAQQRHGILKAMDRVARFFRDAVTLSPRFMLANLWRGKIVAYAQEGQPLYSNTFSGLVDGLKGGEASRNIAAITGFGGYSYGMGERDVAKNFSRKMRIAGGEASMFDRVMQGINAVQHFSEATEMAERVNIYNRLIAEGKTQGEAAWAAYQFAPFSRSGSGEGGIGAVLHSLMPMIPFLNAKVQGLARIIEGQPGDKRFLGLPKQLMLRGMLITAFSIAAAAFARSSDPEAWDKESRQNIMNYDILGYVNGNPITLPRGFEVGTLFGALPVFIMRQFTQEHGDDMGKVLREAVLNTFGFDPLPPAIKPMIEIAANRNFFRGMPIENVSQQRMPAGARVSPTTSETAKLLSGAINASGVPGLFDAQMSPVKAQHLIEGYLGTVGATLVSIVDNIAGASGLLPSKPMGAFGDPYSIPAIAAQTAGLDVFYRSGLNRADRFVNDFYKLERDVNEIYTFLRDAQRNNDTQSLNRMLEEHRIPLSMHKALNNASDQMSKINQRIDFVRRADSISMEDKTEELGKLQKLKSNIARQMIMQAERIGAIQ